MADEIERTNPVREARPLELATMADFEKRVVGAINGRLLGILDELENSRFAQRGDRGVGREIDFERSGRVLFIDGDRGTGKTSVLLTLIREWAATDAVDKIRGSANGNSDDRSALGFNELAGRLAVSRPVLDFDPLPRGLPLHGWLLEPWRRLASHFAATPAHEDGAAADLLDCWHELFETAVVGWTTAQSGNKGIVERTLDYNRQTGDWFDLPRKWGRFVDRIVEVAHAHGHKGHDKPPLFIVAIDDVDLQVERLPELMHALRLLHHPRVVYLLTGHRAHLEDVLHSEFVRQHGAGLGEGHRLLVENDRHGLARRLAEWGRRIAQASLLKSLPLHACYPLERLTLKQTLELNVKEALPKAIAQAFVSGASKGGHPPTLLHLLDQHSTGILPGVGVGTYLAKGPPSLGGRATSAPVHTTDIVPGKLVTIRELQHALDRTTERRNDGHLAHVILRALAGSPGLPGGDPTSALDIHGELTTIRGESVHRWRGTRYGVFVARAPHYALRTRSREAAADEVETTRALLAQVLVELGLFSAPMLTWVPDAGPIWTDCEWPIADSVRLMESAFAVRGRLSFDWPWLLKPHAFHAAEFFNSYETAVSAALSLSDAELTTADIQTAHPVLVADWILLNLQRLDHNKILAPTLPNDEVDKVQAEPAPVKTAEEGRTRLTGAMHALESRLLARRRRTRSTEREREQDRELERWTVQLALLAAPYYGLESETRDCLQKGIVNLLKAIDLSDDGAMGFVILSAFGAELKREEEAAVSTAVENTDSDWHGPYDQDEAVKAFIASARQDVRWEAFAERIELMP